MEVDASGKPRDDLAEYNLDDYDNEAKDSGQDVVSLQSLSM